MRIAVMQPYFFPYIGYFQLIHAVDAFVVYDDVNYIKGGWINRNRILRDGNTELLSLHTSGASQNKLINQVNVGNNHRKLLKTIEQRYGKAPRFKSVFPVIDRILNFDEKNLASFLFLQLREICRYLRLEPRWEISSELSKDTSLKGQDKIIDICEVLGSSHYINAIGGKALYEHQAFRDRGIRLSFLESKSTSYRQFSDEFTPSLSIIDVLMFNDLEACRKLLGEYSLVC